VISLSSTNHGFEISKKDRVKISAQIARVMSTIMVQAMAAKT
jgi:hypothetical protein